MTALSGNPGWKPTYHVLQDHRALELIQMQQDASEQDALAKIETDQSLKTLHGIDKNLTKVGRMLGSKSKSLRRLPKVKRHVQVNQSANYIREHERLAEKHPSSTKGLSLHQLLEL